jgi:DnaJ family protein A protein 2
MADLYAVLGVARSATEEEIRKAYKRRSLETHPDKPGGSKEEFQAVSQAKQILLDPGLRAEYDATGRIPGAAEESGGGGGGMPAGMAEMFGNLFGGGGIPFFAGGGPGPGPGPGQKAPRGPNKIHEIGVSLADLWHGKTIQLNMRRDILCDGCKGRGGTEMKTCTGCNGRGFRMRRQQMGPMMMMSQESCMQCAQTGEEAVGKCGVCAGARVLERETVLQVVIAPGMQEGDRLVFSGQCSESPHFTAPGDVILVIRGVSTDPDGWHRRGSELMVEVRLTLAEAMLGWERTLAEHPSGRPLHVVWTGGPVRDAEVLRIPKQGMPVQGTTDYGDLRIVCRVSEHQDWSEEQRRALMSVWPSWSSPVMREESVSPMRAALP